MRNTGSDLGESLGVESRAEHNLKQKLATLDQPKKAGLLALLESLTIRGKGSASLSEAVNGMSDNDVEDPFYVGDGKDGRMEAIAWITSDDDGLTGNELTVEETSDIVKESL